MLQALDIDLPMPGEGPEEDWWDEDLDDEYDEEDYELRQFYKYGNRRDDDMGEEERQPMSEDEQFNGVGRPYHPQVAYGPEEPSLHARKPSGEPRKRRRRMPPMPRVPREERGNVWVPPFPVDEDGNAVGVPLSHDGDPPIAEIPMAILPDGRVEPFNVPKGSTEAVARMVGPGGSR